MSMRRNLSSKLAGWVGPDIVSVLNAGNGWPSHLQIKTPEAALKVAAHMGPIGRSHRARDGERRFQNPGRHRPVKNERTDLSPVLGLSEETSSPVIVALDAVSRLCRSTRQSLFIPALQIQQAAKIGWAEHVNSTGERITAFTPQRLPEYVQLVTQSLRQEIAYDDSSAGWLRTDATPRIETASASLIKRLKDRPEGMHELTPRQFELLIGELVTDMRLGRIEVTRIMRDGGRDILAYIDVEVGRLLCLIETKKNRPDRPVGVEDVRALYGVMCDEDASHATLVTTSSFTDGARQFQARHAHRLSLRDYHDVVEWIRRYGGRHQ